MYNHLLANSEEVSVQLLDSYFDLIKYNSDILKKNPGSLLEGLKILSGKIEREIKKGDHSQIILNKCWNVIREVG